MKSGRIGRVVQLLTTLQAGKNYSAGDLSNIFGKSRRTIFRDLKELEAIGLPFRYDQKAGGYTVDPEFFLPPLDLNLQEALSLLLLVHKARNNIQLPFKNSALLAGLKIENNLPVKIRQYCDTALKNVSTRPSPQAPASHLDRIFSQLQKALATKHVVQMKYNSLFEGRIIDVELCPCHLLYNHRAWYVLGLSSMHRGVRTFKLNRIKELNLLDKCFVEQGRFDLYEYLGRAWAMISEGRIYNIKLRFLPKVAENVTEVQWHSTQKVTRESDGSAIMELRVDGLNEISWWILGYGDQVQVLAPEALRKRIVEAATNMISINQQV